MSPAGQDQTMSLLFSVGLWEVQYQDLAPGHILQFTVHVLQVRSQHLLGLQGVLTFSLTLLQLDRNRSRRKSLLGHLPSLTAQPSPNWLPHTFTPVCQHTSCEQGVFMLEAAWVWGHINA